MNLFFSDFLCIFAKIRIFIVELKFIGYEKETDTSRGYHPPRRN